MYVQGQLSEDKLNDTHTDADVCNVLLLAWLQYTFCELLDVVQASEMELRQALVDLNACVVHGEYLPLTHCALLPCISFLCLATIYYTAR